jgi:hypothetical protein
MFLKEPLVSPSGSRARCSPVTHQVYVVCSCRHALLDDPTGKSQVGSNQASTSHLYSRLSETRAAASRLCNRLFPSLLSYLIFSCCQLPLCEFPKHTTAFHYRYDIQMYCTFVVFVNQHFLGLPVSGTHCITVIRFRNLYL